MVGHHEGVPDGSLEDIAYLARSANRVDLLAALASGPYARRDLGDLTGVPPTTIGRIVNEFQERGWVERTNDGTYTTTPTGTLVVEEFTTLVDAMGTIRTLGEAAAWIPADELSVGIEDFDDATVRRAPPSDPHDGVEYLATGFRETSAVRVLTFLDAPSPVAEAVSDGLASGDLSAEFVLTGGLVDFIVSGENSPPEWTRYVGDSVDVYRHGGDIPCNLFRFDGSVLVMAERPSAGGGFLESEDESVLAAVDDLIDRYRDAAEPVPADAFA